VLAHPSQCTPEKIEKVKKPCFFLCAENDRNFTAKTRNQCEKILQKNEIYHETKVYPNTKHGFAIRGNEKFEDVRNAKRAATEDTLRFFEKYLRS
jgi:dienelactone hydrolase